jgi:large subunit ribosomal protein L35Ae
MEGVISNYRSSKRAQTHNHIIIKVDSSKNKEQAKKLIGKAVSWTNPEGKSKMQITGKVVKEHGNSGAIRAIFERGLPGQAVGTKVVLS